MSVDHSWFQPLPKQHAFLAATDRECVYAGGFGSGKTLCGGFKALRAALAHPGTVGIVARQTSGALRDNTQKIILDGDDKPPVIPAELVAARNERNGTTITLHNGSQILFRSFQDWNETKLLGPNYGFVYIDEATECTERIWLAFLSRLRHPAGPEQAWATTNPNGHDWLWRRFHPEAEGVGTLFVSRTEENVHLSSEYIRWLRSQPREWQKRFVDASFDTAAGMIWDEWDRNVHVVPAFDVPYNWRRLESLDHGRRNPTAALWAAVDDDSNLLIEDGYYEPGLVAQHAAAVHKIRDPARRYGAVMADPSVFARGFDGQCVADEYRKHGIDLVGAANDVGTGLNRVSEWLTRNPDVVFPDWHQYAGTLGPDGLGAPRLFVLDVPGTADLRSEIPQYRWRDLSPSQEEKIDQPEEPRKKDDHACDALRYLVMSRPRPYEVLSPEEQLREREPAISAGIRTKTF